MNRPPITRILRITWTAGCVTTAVLLCVLWVRSYWWGEALIKPLSPTWTMIFGSADGDLLIRWNSGFSLVPIQTFPQPPFWRQYSVQRESTADRRRNEDQILQSGGALPEYKYGFTGNGAVRMPYWFPLITTIALAAVPWLRPRRFSLRTLLLAVTLGSIVLGLIAWALRG